MTLDELSVEEFEALKSRFRAGRLKAGEQAALRAEAQRLLRDPALMLVSDDFRQELEAFARTLGVDV